MEKENLMKEDQPVEKSTEDSILAGDGQVPILKELRKVNSIIKVIDHT